MYAVCVVYALCSRDFVARNPQGSSAQWIGFINQTLERCICVWVYSRRKYDRCRVSRMPVHTRIRNAFYVGPDIHPASNLLDFFLEYPQGSRKACY